MVVCKTVIASLTPKYIQQAVDYLNNSIDLDVVFEYTLIIIGLSVTTGIFLYLMRRITIGASRQVENDLRNEFFAKLQSLDMDFYHHHQTGDLMARATNDLANIRAVFGPAVMYTVNLIFSFIVYLTMMISISAKLTFWAILPIPVMAVAVYFFGQLIRKKQSVIQKLYGQISNFAQENLAGMRVVKSFALEHDQIRKFTRLNDHYFDRSLNFMVVNSAFHPTIFVIISMSVAAILYVGGGQVINGEITIGDLTAFVLYLGMLTWPSVAIGWVAGLYQTGLASMKRVNDIMNHTNSTVTRDASKSATFQHTLEIRDLTFTYPGGDHPVLHNIDLTLKKGEALGIVGPVGSGKTTLINLINRLYQVEDGHIFLDGSDINDISPEDLHRLISIVPQETFLFSKTIRDNVNYGYDGSPDETDSAVRKAQLAETISEFKDGLQTMLGERGVNLSGGQKQRTAIARAIIKPSDILILDDSLSAVDSETEQNIIRSLIEEQENRTVMIVSHRLSALQYTDQIIFLDEGRIVEAGSHQSLVDLGGRYAQLYEKQRLEQEMSTL